MTQSHDMDLLKRPQDIFFSHSKNLALELQTGDINPDGAAAFMMHGFSALGTTPAATVNLRSKVTDNVVRDMNLVEKRPIAVREVIHHIRDLVQAWELAQTGEIIVPLSAGYDSRLLLWALRDKSRVVAASYGISPNQSKSFEVATAKAVAHRLGVKHITINLNSVHTHVMRWYSVFGVSTHLHGMYHFEFYRKLRSNLPNASSVLSGVFGDVWSGKVRVPELKTPNDLLSLSLSHGIAIPRNAFHPKLQSRTRTLLEEGFAGSGLQTLSPKERIVALWLVKSVLLRYLIEVPNSVGFSAWSPFLNTGVVQSLLRLRDDDWVDRRWQTGFFESVGLNISPSGDMRNTLDFIAHRTQPGPRISAELFEGLVNRKHIDDLNCTLFPARGSRWWFAMHRGNRQAIRRTTSAYNQYVILSALQLFVAGPTDSTNYRWKELDRLAI